MKPKAPMPVLCSRKRNPHVLGRVHETPGGTLILRINQSLRVGLDGRDARDFSSNEAIYLSADESNPVSVDSYCTGCQRRHLAPLNDIFSSAERGAKLYRLQGRNADAAFRPAPN